jgi:hypothetical protein
LDSLEKLVLKFTDTTDTLFPGEAVAGEPFWAIMEIINNENTGNFHSIGQRYGKTMIMLFPQRKMAEWAAKDLGEHSNDFRVRGINSAHLNVLLGLCEDGYPIELVVAAAGLNRSGELMGASMTPAQIRDAITPEYSQS